MTEYPPSRIFSEPTRLAAIRRSGILGGGAEAQFDRLARIVRIALGADAAFVSVVETDRQVFAGQDGLPKIWAVAGQTPISHSFCRHVVEQGSSLVVADAASSGCHWENPAILEMGVGAYVGVPLRLPGGEIVGAVAAIARNPRSWTRKDEAFLEEISAQASETIDLRLSEAKWRTIFGDMQEGFFVGEALRDQNGRVVDFRFAEVNPAFVELTRRAASDVVGRTAREILTPAEVGALVPFYARVVDTGVSETFEFHDQHDGDRWMEVRARRLEGDSFGALFTDATRRIEAETRRRLMNQEMAHRLKNVLAMVKSIVVQTLRTTPDTATASASLTRRIVALSKAHEILLDDGTEGASISAIVSGAMSLHDPDGRTWIMSGPDRTIGPQAALMLALVVHELTTNAVKHGSLSVEGGTVRIAWSMSDVEIGRRPLMTFEWVEQGGPPVADDGRRGFGSRILEMGLPGSATGASKIVMAESGLRYETTAVV